MRMAGGSMRVEACMRAGGEAGPLRCACIITPQLALPACVFPSFFLLQEALKMEYYLMALCQPRQDLALAPRTDTADTGMSALRGGGGRCSAAEEVSPRSKSMAAGWLAKVKVVMRAP